ncbi:MAG: hypothetical protein KC496_20810 [Anaerolineae bacterium]|nr:hypothetical protein [Anaerolineae bacterium]
MNQQQLQRVLNVTDADLAANREGRLSDAQQQRMQPPKVNRLVLYVILGHLLLIGGLLGTIALVTGEAILWLVLLIVVGLGAFPFITMQNEGNIKPALKGDVLGGKVRSTSGFVFIETRGSRRVDLKVNGKIIEATPRQAVAFQNGNEYTLYYLPQSRVLISAEVLTD